MKVRVILITYNHERFIAQAIDSVLAQETTFDWELVILDDCSTDGTREILLDFQRRHPERVRLELAERNQCSNVALVGAFEGAPSEYVAWLDGDDYWSSPHKLQRQAEYLDAHPECALCFHNVLVDYEDPDFASHLSNGEGQQERSTVEDLWAGNFISGCSPMFRKGLLPKLPRWYHTAMWGDWPLYLLFAEKGYVGYIPEVMGVYRVHRRGLWSGLSATRKLESMIAFYTTMNANFRFRYNELVQTMAGRWSVQLGVERAGVPRGATVIVAGGPEECHHWGDRQAWPMLETGGARPADGAAVIARLEELRAGGAGYLVIPRGAFWWLYRYVDLRRHLDAHHRCAYQDDHCLVVQLG